MSVKKKKNIYIYIYIIFKKRKVSLSADVTIKSGDNVPQMGKIYPFVLVFSGGII